MVLLFEQMSSVVRARCLPDPEIPPYMLHRSGFHGLISKSPMLEPIILRHCDLPRRAGRSLRLQPIQSTHHHIQYCNTALSKLKPRLENSLSLTRPSPRSEQHDTTLLAKSTSRHICDTTTVPSRLHRTRFSRVERTQERATGANETEVTVPQSLLTPIFDARR